MSDNTYQYILGIGSLIAAMIVSAYKYGKGDELVDILYTGVSIFLVSAFVIALIIIPLIDTVLDKIKYKK